MRNFIVCFFLLFSSNGFAMFCPTNFTSINIGDSLESVIQLCGEPASQNSLKKTTNLSEEWTYYIKTRMNDAATTKMHIIFLDNRIINISIKDPTENRITTTIPPIKTADNSSVINIVYNNNKQQSRSVGSTSLCGSLIKIGDSMDIVEMNCGKPTSINTNRNPNDTATQIVELKYTGPNAATLIFENGLLKKRI